MKQNKISIRKLILLAAASLSGICAVSAEEPAEGQWKTAYVKRGFCGAFQDGWLKGSGSVIRSRTPMPFDGTRVKVEVSGCHDTVVELENLFLVRGADDNGKITGPKYPILFDGKAAVSFTTGTKKWSDEAEIPIRKGTWYVQDSYFSQKMPYAYDVDIGTCDVKGSDDKEVLSGQTKGSRVGILARIDVFTTDKRPTIVCYGDSITHGFSSTPNSGQRYPDQLAKLLDRPVLNMGVNGDMVQWAGGAPRLISSLKGVDTVVFLMGINDIVTGTVKQLSDYTAKVKPVIENLKKQNLKVYIGTLPPAGGFKKFDDNPEHDKLRQEINKWIRTSSGADKVIDFDMALFDPATPTKMKSEYQSDWIHPNDSGYRKMAEIAAFVISGSSEKKK
ncbi:MAG TPA: hypothetical protein DET40_25705 [Lentisphaeria bacterium]|nr:MAG: hypothetical protein A2X45_14790 [Lentisphaerae bacterium GWF2_50_93]HCE46957.1 hypothetical protein [Lentisphaeria bacterium]